MFRKNKPANSDHRRRPDIEVRRVQTFSYGSTKKPQSDTNKNDRVTDLVTRRHKDKVSTENIFTKIIKKLPAVISITLIILSMYFLISLRREAVVVVKYTSNNEGNQIHSKTDYQKSVQKIIDSSILNKTKLTFNSDSVVEKIKKEFKEVSSVEVAIEFMSQRPKIGIVVSSAQLLLTDVNNEKYVVTDSGVMLKPDKINEDGLYPVNVAYDLREKVNTQFLTRQEVLFMSYVAKQLSNSDDLSEARAKGGPLLFDGFLLPPELGELYVKFKAKEYFAKLSFYEDATGQVGSIKAVYGQLVGEGREPTAYIDSRVGERIFVK